MDYFILISIVAGVIPSLTWLAYYLSRDIHPEPKKMILRIFLWGAFITLPVFFAQIGLTKLLDITAAGLNFPYLNCAPYCETPYLNYLLGLKFPGMNFASFLLVSVYWFLIISFLEELFKYLVVRVKVFNSPHLDEPLDIMLYMVVAALGFTAVENILYCLTPMGQLPFNEMVGQALLISFIRFIGAVLLHTLSSAIIGYSLAISFYQAKLKYIPFTVGFITAVVLHGLYDFSIMTIDGNAKFIIPIIILLILPIFVFLGFEKLKKMKGICLATPDLAKRDKIK